MIFICPQPPRMTIDGVDALYPFPRPPKLNAHKRIILDSGAFGLAQRGKAIDYHHMRRLAGYYRKYGASNDWPVVGIAPDVFLDHNATMKNWRWWHDNIGLPVVPVIQFSSRRLDPYVIIRQSKFYAGYKPPVVAIGNPMLSATESRELMPMIAYTVRQITGARWIHHLGAGWSPKDIMAWREMNCFDSIDSIAYYTDAQNGKMWHASGGITLSTFDFTIVARHNAFTATLLAKGESS